MATMKPTAVTQLGVSKAPVCHSRASIFSAMGSYTRCVPFLIALRHLFHARVTNGTFHRGIRQRGWRVDLADVKISQLGDQYGIEGGRTPAQFPDRATYDRVRVSGVLSRAAVCRIFGIVAAEISDHVEFDPALAIKFTIYRRMPSGSPGDADIFGSQQYGPLLDIEAPAG
jgi:hypothetical protein